MLKKSNNYKAYILFESLVALSLLCLITVCYISSNTFLLQKNKQSGENLQLHRILYEEMKRYENHGGSRVQEVHINNTNYQLQFYEANNRLIEVEITDGKETFSLKKE